MDFFGRKSDLLLVMPMVNKAIGLRPVSLVQCIVAAGYYVGRFSAILSLEIAVLGGSN